MPQMETLRIHISAGGQDTESASRSAAAREALDFAGAELREEGIPVTVQELPTASGIGERAIGFDDLLIGIAGNAISTLLISAVHEMLVRLRRVAWWPRRARPRHIRLQAGEYAIELDGDMPLEVVRERLESWVPLALAAGSGEITIAIIADGEE